MTKYYAFNNLLRLNKLIKLYESYSTVYTSSTKMIDFSNYVKSIEYNRDGSEFYHVSCIYTGILCKKINSLCTPDRSIFREGMTVWEYIVAFCEKQNQQRLEKLKKVSSESHYLTEIESKRKSELEKLSYICNLKKDATSIQNELNDLSSKMSIYQTKLSAVTTIHNDIEEYVSLMSKREDHRPDLYRRIRSCAKSGELPYHEFEALCEEFSIDDEMINDYISNHRIKYAFKPYIICKYA